jgi:hypothetical protein
MSNEINGTRPVYILETGEFVCQRCGHKWLPRKIGIESISCPQKKC